MQLLNKQLMNLYLGQAYVREILFAHHGMRWSCGFHCGAVSLLSTQEFVCLLVSLFSLVAVQR